MSTGRKIKIPGYTFDKNGKLKRFPKGLSVSTKIARRKKPKVSYKRGN